MRRLVLFDIDGTILSTNGAAKRAFRRAMRETYGTAGPIDSYDFSGKTDPQIARDLLRAAGLGDPEIDARTDTLWRRYLRQLKRIFRRPDHRTTLLPGVATLLDAMDARTEDALMGLLTGNIRPGARLKLASVGLDGRFRTGAFGSDCERRDGLPSVAVRRARELTGREFDGDEIVIIGDTPHDVTCGAALGVRAVGVATGRHDAAALAAAGADVVLPDLADTDRALAALLEP